MVRGMKNLRETSPAPPDIRRGQESRLAVVAIAMIALSAMSGCVHDPTVGPLFEPAAEAPTDFARVYLYRIDPHHSYSMVEVRFDDEDPLQLLDEEYITVQLEEGTHEVAFRLRRRFGWPWPAWRTQRIRAKSGETLYFEISVGVTDRVTSSSRDLDIAGRASTGTANEVANMRLQTESEAVERIRLTHRHAP